jgi:hypothetical protein
MWNPLHLSVYAGHTDFAKYICDNNPFNISKLASKPNADNEGDPSNDEGNFIEDQVFLL